MSTSRSTHLNSQEGKRAMSKMADASRYKRFATVSEDKAGLRADAERALQEWKAKQPPRANLDDRLRRKY